MIQLANLKKQEPYDLYIGRVNHYLGLDQSKWANPFVLKREADRPAVLEQYRKYILSRPDLIEALPELEGLTLGCYCSPRLCHGNALIELYTQFYGNSPELPTEWNDHS